MKRIGIISDTHGTFDGTLREFLKDVDEIWHAGDIGSLELADAIAVVQAPAGRIGQHRRRPYAPRIPRFPLVRMRRGPGPDDPHRRLPAPLRPARRGEDTVAASRNSSSPDTRTSSRSPTTRFTTCCTSIPAPPESTGSTKSAPPCGWSSTAPTCATWRSANGRGDSRNGNKICGVMTPHILLLLDKSAA